MAGHDEQDDNDRVRRQAALRALAQNQPRQPSSDKPGAVPQAITPAATSPSAHPTFAARLKRQQAPREARVAIMVATVVVIIAIVAGAFIGFKLGVFSATSTGPAPKPMLRIAPANDGLTCIQTSAWSPDSKYIAALGYTQQCGSSFDSQDGAIYVYDVQTGKVAQRFQPDQLIFREPHIANLIGKASNQVPAGLFYQSMSWTPGGKALALLFGVDFPTTNPQGGADQQVIGVLLLTGSAATTRIWVDPALILENGKVLRWDLISGQSDLIPAPAPSAAYHWNSDGSLSPDESGAQRPVGSPDSGQRFTIWQSGALTLSSIQQAPNQPAAPVAGDVVWGAQIVPMSPDGRYLYLGVSAYGSLIPPSTHQAFAQEVAYAPHDVALQALARSLLSGQPSSGGASAAIQVVWRPDGRLLAALTTRQPNGTTTAVPDSAFTVSIYDTATGKLLKRLTPSLHDLTIAPSGTGPEALLWSPDGKRLLLIDNTYGAMTIWGPGALPQ